MLNIVACVRDRADGLVDAVRQKRIAKLLQIVLAGNDAFCPLRSLIASSRGLGVTAQVLLSSLYNVGQPIAGFTIQADRISQLVELG